MGTYPIGYSVSADGIHWPAGRLLNVQIEGPGARSTGARTPLSLIREPDGTYSLFCTGFRNRAHAAAGLAIVRLEKDQE